MPQLDKARVASAMLALVEHSDSQPVQKFLCYWVAFTNIQIHLAAQAGLKPRFGLRKNGTLRTHNVHGVKMAEVSLPTERAQYDKALASFSSDLKHQLILHESTRFFVYRAPVWQTYPRHQDALKQRLNGVANLALTLDARYPIWAPLDVQLYEHYLEGEQTQKASDALVHQIFDVLRTVYSNLLYADLDVAENSSVVVGHALALLTLIVHGFLPEP